MLLSENVNNDNSKDSPINITVKNLEVEHVIFTLESSAPRAGSLVMVVLLIQCVRCTTEFQVVEMYQFPLPGVIDSLDTMGQFANPSHHNVRTLP